MLKSRPKPSFSLHDEGSKPGTFRYHEDGTLYTCADEGYFCEIENGICTECGWPYDKQGDRVG